MALSGVHFILTYRCTMECEHCFVFGSPRAGGTFTAKQLEGVFAELPKIGTIKSVYFEGGEPFLFYPLLVEGVKAAGHLGYETGIVSNGYWATSEEDAALWLRPLAESGLGELGISDDPFHSGDSQPASNALAAAEKLGITAYRMSVEKPKTRGKRLDSGGVMFRGRAAERLAKGLPGKTAHYYIECPYEDLKEPQRFHLDAHGNVLLCQGLSIGNMWQTPLSELVKGFDCRKHPVCRHLLEGGPARLAREHGLAAKGEYVDACHLCYLSRKALRDKYPDFLAPKQLYGEEE